MKRTILAAAMGMGSLLSVTSLQAMTIDIMDDASSMAQYLVGDGIAISNVSYSGNSAAAGYFSGGEQAGIGLESGIVLTSGKASHLNGTTNSSSSKGSSHGLAGNSALDSLLPAMTQSYDAAVLEFDFISSGDAASFQYVFGSEEYMEWVNKGFNDVFGFYLDGENIAVLPDGETAVSVDNVNAYQNSDYYVDNKANWWSGESAYGFEYDGFTTTMTAAATNLVAGQSYHLMLTIGDVGDHILDSGVFIQAGSFSSRNDGAAPVPEPATIFLFGVGLSGLGAAGKRRQRQQSKNQVSGQNIRL